MIGEDLKIWDAAADSWDRNVATDNTPRTMLFKDSLPDLLGNVSGKKILDAGCGNGRLSDALANEGAEVIGIDGSEKMIEKAKSRYPSRNFLNHDLLKPLPFENNTFDLVLANMVLMHLSQIETFLGETERILKPGGSMVASILHPCFNLPVMRLHRGFWPKLLGGKVVGIAADYYRQPGNRRYEGELKQSVTHYHRTLEQYSKEFARAGLAIEEMREPHELPEEYLRAHPKLEYATRLPRFIIFKTIKRTL